MSGIFDILPLILTGVSLLLGEGLNNHRSGDRKATAKAGENILKDCERLIKSLSPYQRKLLARCLVMAITERPKARDY
jgi:hypothetical protein